MTYRCHFTAAQMQCVEHQTALTETALALLIIGCVCLGVVIGFAIGRWSGRLAERYDLNEAPEVEAFDVDDPRNNWEG